MHAAAGPEGPRTDYTKDFGKVADEMEANVFGREWVPGTWAATMAGGSLLDARLCNADGAASFTDGGVKTF